VLERYADECFLTDMRDDAMGALDTALAIRRDGDDVIRLGETQRLRSRLLVCAGQADRARLAADEAVALLEQAEPGRELARTYAQLSEISMRADAPQEAIRWGRRAMALAEQVADSEALIHAMNNVGAAEFSRGLDGGREKLERSILLAKEAGLPNEAGKAYVNLQAMLSRQREWLLIDRLGESGIDYCREHGLDAWLGYLMWGKAEGHLVRGQWSDAAEAATSMLANPQDGVIGPRFGGRVILALVRARRGDPGCWPLLDEALDLADGTGELQYLATVAVARAEAAWLDGRPDAIAAETDRAFTLAIELDEPSALGELALWRWRAGLLTDPPARAEELFREQIAGESERVAEIRATQGCRYEAALALADADDEAALRRAHDELRKLGAAPAAAIVARRLRERGARGVRRGPRPATKANPAGLTARELEILPLLASGLRNAEIAARLVISERTVDHHVSAILRKLDVRTRSDARAKATRLGLTSQTSE
jgi:DNA-binding CsgD family transcriptional regulator